VAKIQKSIAKDCLMLKEDSKTVLINKIKYHFTVIDNIQKIIQALVQRRM
jgi:hypothetical protein